MKYSLIAAGLLLAAPLAHAQVTLEHRYRDVNVTKFSNGDLKYTVDDAAAGRVTIYNEDHSLLRQLTVPAAPAGYTFDNTSLVSDKLFNTDAQIEYMASYSRNIPVNNTNLKRVYIFTETGTQLALIDTVSTADYVFRGNTGLKLYSVIDKYDAAGTYLSSYTKIFGLGGTSSPLVNRAATVANEAMPFPNPAHERITLPYTVPAGQTATLEVLDLTGRVARTYRVDATFDHLLLDARALRTGAYTYRLRRADGAVVAGHRFVVE